MQLSKVLVALLLPIAALGKLRVSQSQELLTDAGLDSSKNGDLSSIIAKSPLLSLHRALVEVESISNNEEAIGKLLTSMLEAHNFSVIKQEVELRTSNGHAKKRWNIYATPDTSKFSDVEPSKDRPKVLLTSHIDTVPPFIPYSLSRPSHKSKRKDILISGRGTVDAKACVAAMIQAALELLSSSEKEVKPSDLALLFVVGEENRGDGMSTFSRSRLYHKTKSNYKAVIFGEPTEGKLARGHKGISMARIQAHGKAAHSGYPWLGRSANSMILPALTLLDKLGDIPEDKGGLPTSEDFGNSTVNVGYMTGGVAANVVPEYAEAKVSFRLAGGTPEKIRNIILNAIRSVDPEELLDVDIFQGYGPVPLDSDVEGFTSIIVNYGTDVPNLEVAEGVKRYLYGPGSILVAHGAKEGLTIGDMEQAVVDYKKLVLHALRA